MNPRLSRNFSLFGVLVFVLKSFLGIARQWSREKCAILTLKYRSHVRVLICRTWAIGALSVPFPRSHLNRTKI